MIRHRFMFLLNYIYPGAVLGKKAMLAIVYSVQLGTQVLFAVLDVITLRLENVDSLGKLIDFLVQVLMFLVVIPLEVFNHGVELLSTTIDRAFFNSVHIKKYNESVMQWEKEPNPVVMRWDKERTETRLMHQKRGRK